MIERVGQALLMAGLMAVGAVMNLVSLPAEIVRKLRKK